MEVSFVFIDESTNSRLETPLSSCTGLIVPARRYDDLRLGVYKALDREIQPFPNHFAIPPELHWRNFLPEASDERKVEVLRRLVALPSKIGASLCRVSYFVTEVLEKAFLDPELRHFCFFALQVGLRPLTEAGMLVPVVDAGFVESFRPIVGSLSGSNRLTETLRSAGIDPGFEEWNPANYSEVFYADSEYSASLQLTDVFSGLRNLVDTERVDPSHSFTPFKKSLLHLGHELDSQMLFDQITSMTFKGIIEGPARFAASTPEERPGTV